MDENSNNTNEATPPPKPASKTPAKTTAPAPQPTRLQNVEAAIKTALEHAMVLAEKELAHCPSAAALQSRVGNALEMLEGLKREAATLKAPDQKAG
jgi:hypothetical protein